MARHGTSAASDDKVDLMTPFALTAYQVAAVLAVTFGWGMTQSVLDGESAGVWVSHLLGASDLLSLPTIAPLVLWTGLVTTAGCALAEAVALGELSSAEATVVFSTEPLWG